jgi:hypothetical protein
MTETPSSPTTATEDMEATSITHGHPEPALSPNGSTKTAHETEALDMSIVRKHLAPLDMYTEDGVYWADLKWRQKVRLLILHESWS